MLSVQLAREKSLSQFLAHYSRFGLLFRHCGSLWGILLAALVLRLPLGDRVEVVYPAVIACFHCIEDTPDWCANPPACAGSTFKQAMHPSMKNGHNARYINLPLLQLAKEDFTLSTGTQTETPWKHSALKSPSM